MNDTKCLVPGCEKGVTIRGLCQGHYQSAQRLIKSGKITWEKLEAAGKCLPSRNKATANRGWLMEGLE